MKPLQLPNKVLVSIMAFAAIGLLTGLFTGLNRLGYFLHTPLSLNGALHGPLMINAFLGTLISLERAAALENRWVFLTPVLMAASVLSMLFFSVPLGSWLFTAGAAGFVFTLIYISTLQPKIYHYIMVGGGLALLCGNILFLTGSPVSDLVIWWLAFPLLTIFGERLELNRIMRPPQKAQWLFTALIILWLAGSVIMHFNRVHGLHIVMFSTLAIALWLFKYDIARKTIKASGWTRFSAVCLLSGYIWLILASITGFAYGLPAAGYIYDALLHMIFVGFVFSMIFAHASLIIPALSGKTIPWTRYFYLPLIILHATLILRVAGNLGELLNLRVAGSWGNVAAIILFLGGVIFNIFRNKTS